MIYSKRYIMEKFDKVVAGNVIHLLPNYKTVMHELERVTKPGGKKLATIIKF